MPKRYCSIKDYTKKAFIHNQAKTMTVYWKIFLPLEVITRFIGVTFVLFSDLPVKRH